MKIKSFHYNYMKEEITKIILKAPDMYQKYKSYGLSNKRYRWDLFHAANLSLFACRFLYSYLDDSHIDTALRKITNTK